MILNPMFSNIALNFTISFAEKGEEENGHPDENSLKEYG